MFSWIPILGPILQSMLSSVSNIYSKYKDTELGKYKVDGEVAATSASVVIAYKDDPGLKVLRDTLIAPVVVWSALGYWDKIVEHRYPDLVWEVHAFKADTPLGYLPYAVIVFLLGNLWLNKK